jgi:hypothetical protein
MTMIFPIGQSQIIPFSIYDKVRNTGFVNIAIDHNAPKILQLLH